MIITTFFTHYYEWEGDIFLQLFGCPMGMRPSGPVARLLVDDVVEEVEAISTKTQIMARSNPIQYEALVIHMLEIFVDDGVGIMDSLRNGAKFDPILGILIWDMEKETATQR